MATRNVSSSSCTTTAAGLTNLTASEFSAKLVKKDVGLYGMTIGSLVVLDILESFDSDWFTRGISSKSTRSEAICSLGGSLTG